MEIPTLKENNGKDLCRFHDILQQHLHALNVDTFEPLSQFITSVIQLKLDLDTMFEWQKHTQDTAVVPHHQQLLEFIDLCARASESSTTHKRVPKTDNSSKKSVTSFAASSNTLQPPVVSIVKLKIIRYMTV